MTTVVRQAILRANALYLLTAASSGMLNDILGIFFGRGPVAYVVHHAPDTGIGFVEAHGLAFIVGVLLWRAEPSRAWHLVGVAVHVLLGTSNLVFWQLFIAADMLVMGYVTTSLHWLFAALQLWAAVAAASSMSWLAKAGHPVRRSQAVIEDRASSRHWDYWVTRFRG
jgi:hypothetical protein